jgi:predicted nucleotidyltransferase
MVKISELKKELKPLLRFKEDIELIYIYGSFKSGNYGDIDILVVVDEGLSREKLLLVNSGIHKVKKDSRFDFHFQGVKSLSAWWNAVIDGEPWIITSLKNSIVLFDKTGVLKEIKSLIKNEETYNRESRVDKLINSSKDYELEIRNDLLQSISDLSSIATEVAQIYLLKRNIVLVDKKKILNALRKFPLGEYVDDYNDIIDLESKYQRGFLTEFTSENLEYYLEKIKDFVRKLEKN